jgi:hypothetical protein
MNDKTKLLLALQQVDNLAELLKENKYRQFLYSHLISLRTELQRQLSHYGKETN